MKIVKVILLFLMIIGIGACYKKRGCSNDEAINYDPGARKTDYSCVYEYSVRISWSNSFSYFVDNDINYLNLYIRDSLILENINVFEYDPMYPSYCQEDYWPTINLTELKTYNPDEFVTVLTITDQNNNVLSSIEKELELGCNGAGFTFQ